MPADIKSDNGLGRGAWIVSVTIGCLGATYATLAGWALLAGLWSGRPFDAGILVQNPWDPYWYAVFAIVWGIFALELLANGWRSHPLRRLLRNSGPSDRTDLFYTIANLTGWSLILELFFSGGLSLLVDRVADAGFLHFAAGLSLWVAVPILFVGADFLGYWGHRAMHLPIFWPLHAVHHAAEDMTALTTLRNHPIDGLIGNFWLALFAGLFGFETDAVLTATVLTSVHANLLHSAVPFPAALERFVAGPRAHRIHHAVVADCVDRNFARLSLFDRLFGTFYMRDVRELKTGVSDPFYHSGRPMREMVLVMGRWLSELRDAIRRRGTAGAAVVIATLLLGAMSVASRAATMATVETIAAEGTQFRVTLTDGRVMRSPELVGAKLIVATPSGPAKIRIAAVERDPTLPSDDVWLHTLLVENPDGSTQNMCDTGPDGRQQGFPLATRERADHGSETTAPEQFDLVCSAGARAKCVRFGYRPWVPAEERLYNSCVRMVPADYCGMGNPTTRNGMQIDLYDTAGIQKPDNAATQEFEAGWSPEGAVCVHHPRVAANISLETLAASCPRLAGKVGALCTEATARSLGATLFNRSAP